MSARGEEMEELVAGKPVEFDQPLTFRFTCCECLNTHLFVLESHERPDGNTEIRLRIYGDDHETEEARRA